jgi:hypothetical protein
MTWQNITYNITYNITLYGKRGWFGTPANIEPLFQGKKKEKKEEEEEEKEVKNSLTERI